MRTHASSPRHDKGRQQWVFFRAQKEAGRVKIYCDNERCKYNDAQTCTQNLVYYVGRKCMTYRDGRHHETSRLMWTSERTGCRKRGGRYVSDARRIIK